MQKQLFSTLLLLIWGSLLALPSYAQDNPASLYKQLNQNLAKGNYAQALKLIDQGADILHGGRYISSTYKVKAKKMPGFLVLLTLPVSLLNRSYTKTDHYDKLTIALHEVLKDTTRSPAKLQIVEYLLKKGAPPNGGRLLYGPEVRPVATAIKSWDLEAFWLLKKYGAKLDSKKVNVLAALVNHCDCYAKDNDPKFHQLEQTIHTLVKQGLDPYNFYYRAMQRSKVAALFFKYISPKDLDLNNRKNPIEIACSNCDLTLIQQLKKQGFTWEEEKKQALRLAFHDLPACHKVIEYYVKKVKGIDINQRYNKSTLLCRAIKYFSLPLVQKLLELGANFHDVCTNNAFNKLIYDRYNYDRLYKKETKAEDLRLWKSRYHKALQKELYLLKLIETYPRKQRKKLRKDLQIKKLLKQYPRNEK